MEKPDSAWREQRKKAGMLGEALARKFLKGRGFVIRESNYLKKWGEIDVIAERKGRIHFVEVKALTQKHDEGSIAYRPEENVHPQKLKRLFATIYSYLQEHTQGDEQEWQLDVIAVIFDPETKKARVRVIENVTL